MYLIIPIKPFPAKRLNAKWWRFTKTAIDYHNKKKALEPYLLPHSEEIMRNMIRGTYHLQFHTKMADSWSEKKKKEMDWKPNQNTPDIDNLFKAFTDTLFYNKDKFSMKKY